MVFYSRLNLMISVVERKGELMSVLIKDMKKLKSCYAVIDGESEYCPFVNTDDDCVLLLEKGTCEGTWEEQYSKCPLVEVPEPCEDAVSREAVSKWLKQYGQDVLHGKYKFSLMYIWKNLMDLPSVTPKRKTGRWLDNYQYGYKCSECGAYLEIDCGDVEMNFCPNCNADMRGKQDE